MMDIGHVLARIERLEVQKRSELLDLANSGEVRCWLDGVNEGDEKLTLTIYGKLTPEDRRCIIDFAVMIDKRPVAPST